MKDQVIQVEINAQRNRNLYFAPLDRVLRGRFDWKRVADRNSAELRETWGEAPIPGQQLTLDVESREAALIEPLHGRPELKKRIESRGQTLPAARQVFADVDVNAWLYWLKAAVAAGDAVLIQGALPESVDYVPKRFGEQKPQRERVTEALIAVLYSSLTEKQRKEVAQLVGS